MKYRKRKSWKKRHRRKKKKKKNKENKERQLAKNKNSQTEKRILDRFNKPYEKNLDSIIDINKW